MTTLITLLVLTIPQRSAMTQHLAAWGAQSRSKEIRDAIVRMMPRIMSGKVTTGPDSDLEVLQAAVYLAGARDKINGRELRCLEKAWTRLGWEFREEGRATAAEFEVRRILNPPTTPADIDPDMSPRARITQCGQRTWPKNPERAPAFFRCHYHATGGPRADSCGPDDYPIDVPTSGPPIVSLDPGLYQTMVMTMAELPIVGGPAIPPTAPATPEGEGEQTPDLNWDPIAPDPVKVEYARREAEALQYLEHGCDGPVTRFVVISRAIALARSGKFPPAGQHSDDPIGNALFAALYGPEGEDKTLIEGNGS